MNVFDALILGIVEGITEFLPISSTGHMILTSYLLNIHEDTFIKSFEIIIQLGAILAVVYIYRDKVFRNLKLMGKICIAFIPTAIIGLVMYSLVKKYLLSNIWVVICSLFLGGVTILYFEYKHKNEVQQDVLDLDENSVSIKQAIYIGLFQSIAIIPGVSRSAATIIGGQIVGLSRKVIVEFSFLLAIPVMFSATALDIYKHHNIFTSNEIGLLSVGFLVAFLVALISIKTFLSYIQKHSFAVFGIYRVVLSLVFLIYLYFI